MDSYNPSHHLLKHFQKTQYNLYGFMNTCSLGVSSPFGESRELTREETRVLLAASPLTRTFSCSSLRSLLMERLLAG